MSMAFSASGGCYRWVESLLDGSCREEVLPGLDGEPVFGEG